MLVRVVEEVGFHPDNLAIGRESAKEHALLAALKGDYATAEQYVTEAGEQGVAEAAECLERIRRAALE